MSKFSLIKEKFSLPNLTSANNHCPHLSRLRSSRVLLDLLQLRYSHLWYAHLLHIQLRHARQPRLLQMLNLVRRQCKEAPGCCASPAIGAQKWCVHLGIVPAQKSLSCRLDHSLFLLLLLHKDAQDLDNVGSIGSAA
jgi:hypothetical protein